MLVAVARLVLLDSSCIDPNSMHKPMMILYSANSRRLDRYFSCPKTLSCSKAS